MTENQVDDIRVRMARIRTRAERKATRLGEETRQFLDWKHYVRLFPWAALGAAALAGYWIVPRRKVTSEASAADAKALVDLARQGQIVVKSANPRPSMIGRLVSLAGPFVMRAAMNYASQQVGRILSTSTAPQYQPQENRYEPAEPLA